MVYQAWQCRHPGCRRAVSEYVYPDGERVWYCDEHAPRAGWCLGCQGFFGGTESFSYRGHRGYCTECSWELDRLTGWTDEAFDDWEDDVDPDDEEDAP